MRRKMRPSREVRSVIAKLKRIHNRRPKSVLRHRELRGAVRKMVAKGDVRPGSDLQERIEHFIDGSTESIRDHLRREHEAEMFELDELLMLVEPLVEAQRKEVDNDERALEEVRSAIEAIIEDLVQDGLPKRSFFFRRGLRNRTDDHAIDVDAVPNREGPLPEIMAKRWWSQVFFVVVLLAAVAVDAVTFYQVLALVMTNLEEWMVYVAVLGFTLVTLSLAHSAGFQAVKHADKGNAAITSKSAWAVFTVWLALGVVAFTVRYVAPSSNAYGVDLGQEASPGLSALLFLSLFLATGAVAGLAGYNRPHPAIHQYWQSKRTERAAVRRLKRSSFELDSVQSVVSRITALKELKQGSLSGRLDSCHSVAAQLKAEAAMLIENRRYRRRRRG